MNYSEVPVALMLNSSHHLAENQTRTALPTFTSGALKNAETSSSHSPVDIFRLSLSSAIFLSAIFGNIAAILYIFKHKQLRSIKNYYYGYYLINLNVADLLVAIFCIPFTVIYYESKKWKFGWLFCKAMPSIQVMVVSASICTLATITWERYRAIIHPMTPRSTMFGLRVKILTIWLWSTAVAAPSFYAYEYNEMLSLYQCQEIWPSHYQRQAYTAFIFLVNYALPLSFILTAYFIIVIRLKFGLTPYSERASKLLQNRFIKLMTLLISCFAICNLPIYVCFFIMDFSVVENHFLLSNAINFSQVLIWLNSCLNPFFYCALRGLLHKARSESEIPCRIISGSPPIRQRESFRRLIEREEDRTTCQRHQGLSNATANEPLDESYL